ncbi:MAG: hypothetical protein JNK64_23735 [Myxococcales bacterium]|nr:hypothetical protein [Myxococcales bacterium]
MRASAWAAIVAGVALAATPAIAGPPDAGLWKQAEADFEAGRFAEALAAFETLYQLKPQPELLFAMGRCHQQLGDCVRATERFRAFLATGPDPAARDAAEARMAACAPAAPIDAPPTGGEVAPGPAPSQPATEAAPRPRRGVMLGLAGAGVAAGAVAITLEVMGRRALDASTAAGAAGDRVGRDGEYDRAQRLHVGAQVGGVVAVGCVAAAAVLWWRRPTARPQLALVPRHDGGAVVWSGAF